MDSDSSFTDSGITKKNLSSEFKHKGHATLGVFRRARLDFLGTTLRQSTPRQLHCFSHWDFHRAISCSVTVSEDGFPKYNKSNSLKIYLYPWLRLIS